ncbi:MAG: alpha/beta fold hydrolase [Rhizobiaceae bacterium]
MSSPAAIEFAGADGNALRGDLWDGRGHPVIFLHGGGQTRKAWDATARRVAAAGMRAITVDQRGHGDSDWSDDGDYRFARYAEDAAQIVRQVAERFHAAPSGVGASLGGISLLGAELRSGPMLESLVMVDIVPNMDRAGVSRVQGFMSERLDDGFATLEDASDAIAAYLPHRRRPASLDGLAKNLRLGEDGRYRWHWDPAFMRSDRNINAGAREMMADLMAALPKLRAPLLLVRGGQSEIVEEATARDFVALAPTATYVDVSGAGHMVAGDRNDVFCDAILEFLTDREAA